MHVIATAGHVDHGKSTLVRALTGQDPDRLEEEHRRGLSITLGYCWARFASTGPAATSHDIAFVDVPGHERFVSTMLAGVGAVPAVLFVVAADDPWMPQAAEHLAALDALGVSHGLLVVTRSDVADPGPARLRAERQLAATSLARVPSVAVSAVTGHGMARLERLLLDLVARLPQPDPDADVRLWLDRVFTVRGSGTVVTGTLAAGRVGPGDTLMFAHEAVRVRSVQALGHEVSTAQGVARVALRLGGGAPEGLQRGSVLCTPDAWWPTTSLDVSLTATTTKRPPGQVMLHIGAAATRARFRALGGDIARLSLDEPLPLRIGDRALLRDPGSRRVWGVVVLDPDPPAFTRRGDASRRAEVMSTAGDVGSPGPELRRRRLAKVSHVRRLGVDISAEPSTAVRYGDWALDASVGAELRERLGRLVEDRKSTHPLDPALPLSAAARALGLPTLELVSAIVTAPLRVEAGAVMDAARTLPDHVENALAELVAGWAPEPFAAPGVERLSELGLDARAVAAAGRAGRLLRLNDTVVLLPGADDEAARRLATLAQPFTTSEARQHLRTSRRVVLPLLEHMDRRGLTRRLVDDRRTTA